MDNWRTRRIVTAFSSGLPELILVLNLDRFLQALVSSAVIYILCFSFIGQDLNCLYSEWTIFVVLLVSSTHIKKSLFISHKYFSSFMYYLKILRHQQTIHFYPSDKPIITCLNINRQSIFITCLNIIKQTIFHVIIINGQTKYHVLNVNRQTILSRVQTSTNQQTNNFTCSNINIQTICHVLNINKPYIKC